MKYSDHDYHNNWPAISHCISYLFNVLNWNKRFNWNCDHDYYDDWSAIMMIGFWLELGHHWCSGCLVSRIRLAHIHQNIYISFLFIFYLSLYLSDRRIFIPRQNQNENIKYKNRNTERLAHIHPKTKEETFWPSDQYCVPFRVGNFFIIHNKYSLISSCWNWFSLKTCISHFKIHLDCLVKRYRVQLSHAPLSGRVWLNSC